MKFCALLAIFLLHTGVRAQVQSPALPRYDPTPRLGILVPKGPPDYAPLLNALHGAAHVQDGPFDFQTGTISGTPVVLIIQPAPGEVLRALGAITMVHDFNLRVLLYYLTQNTRAVAHPPPSNSYTKESSPERSTHRLRNDLRNRGSSAAPTVRSPEGPAPRNSGKSRKQKPTRSRPKVPPSKTLGYKVRGGGVPTIADQPKPLRIGVLALQGAFDVHAAMLRPLGAEAVLIRKPDQLYLPGGQPAIDGLIIPGGESTTFLKHLEQNNFFEALYTFVRTAPTFGTCAGCILLATDVQNPAQRSFAALDITVERNAYGRQIDSAILSAPTSLPGPPLEMVFIRAPRITRTGPGVETLAERDGFPVLVRNGPLLASTFHPELSTDTRIHQLFLDLVSERTSSQPT